MAGIGKDWKGLKSIGLEEKTVQKDGVERKECDTTSTV